MVQVGVSLKLYLGLEATLEWARGVAMVAAQHPATCSGSVSLWVAPSFPLLPLVASELAAAPVQLAAQDLHWADRGPYTGAVSGADLADLGCRYVEVGHLERRTVFGETDQVVAAKVAAAVRNSLVPVLCLGESDHGRPDRASATCLSQLDAATSALDRDQLGRLVVAYEPGWAIGAPAPAPGSYVAEVCRAVRDGAGALGLHAVEVIYGGAAGPGTLTALGGSVDGVFLGRFAHDTADLTAVLDEAAALAAYGGG